MISLLTLSLSLLISVPTLVCDLTLASLAAQESVSKDDLKEVFSGLLKGQSVETLKIPYLPSTIGTSNGRPNHKSSGRVRSADTAGT